MPATDAAGIGVMWGECGSEYTCEYEGGQYQQGYRGVTSREPPYGPELSEYGRIIPNPQEVPLYLGPLYLGGVHIGYTLLVPDPGIYERVRNIRDKCEAHVNTNKDEHRGCQERPVILIDRL